ILKIATLLSTPMSAFFRDPSGIPRRLNTVAVSRGAHSSDSHNTVNKLPQKFFNTLVFMGFFSNCRGGIQCRPWLSLLREVLVDAGKIQFPVALAVVGRVETAGQCPHGGGGAAGDGGFHGKPQVLEHQLGHEAGLVVVAGGGLFHHPRDRKSTRLNSSHVKNSYAVVCLKK